MHRKFSRRTLTDQDLLAAFLEHIPDHVYFKDRDSRFVFISRSLATHFGLSDPAQALNKTDFDMFSSEHAEQAFADEQEIIRTGQPIIEKEEKETWLDGREAWALTTKVPLRDQQGQIIGTMGISRDITARRLAEQELQQYKTQLEELVAARTTELTRANEQLRNLSLIDDLTGLNNRRGFLALAEHQVKSARRTGKPFLLAFVDLDGLKQINDAFGHQEGDRALVEAANLLKDSVRQSDILARMGGDEFAILVTDAAEASIDTVIDRVRQKLDRCNGDPGRHYRLSFSIGILLCDATEPISLEKLLHQADALMYRQKQHKKVARNGQA